MQVTVGYLVGCVGLSLWIASGRQVCVSKRYTLEAVYKPRGSLLYPSIGLSVDESVIWFVVMGADAGGIHKPGQDLAAIP